MKRALLYIFPALILLASCQKDDSTVFDKSPDQRLNETLLAYQTQLVGATDGWKAIIYPAGGGGYSYYMRFNDQNRVSMIADFDATSSSTLKESSYRLKALQQPSLIFDTYSYLHLPADPLGSINGGSDGQGLRSDFEFSLDSAYADSITLTGRYNHTKLTLVKATKQEADDYTSGNLGTIFSSTAEYISNNLFLYLQFPDGNRTDLAISPRTKEVTLTYLDAQGNIVTLSSLFSFSLAGIYLKDPIIYGGKEFHELIWDSVKKVYYIMLDNARIDVRSAPSPIIPLYKRIGLDFTLIVIPPPSGLPGQSPDFTAKYLEVKNSLINGPFGLELEWIVFRFDAGNKQMNLEVYISQDGDLFRAVYSYSYMMSATGVFNFTRTGLDGNAELIEADVAPLLQHVDSDNFSLDYYLNGSTVLGGMYSVQRPGFLFYWYS